MQTVNIFSALLDAAGYEEDTLRFLRKVWTFYRNPPDTKGGTYWRYNYNYGRRLAERGDLGQDVGSMEAYIQKVARGEADFQALDNGFQFLARAASEGGLIEARLDLAWVRALILGPKAGLEVLQSVFDALAQERSSALLSDACYVFALLREMAGEREGALANAENSRQIAEHNGDEPRRARACSLLGRLFAVRGAFIQAEDHLAKAEKVAQRLALRVVEADSCAARGYVAAARGDFALAVSLFMLAAQFFKSTQRRPKLLPVLSELAWAAANAGQSDLTVRVLDQLEELAPQLPGYQPHIHIVMAQLYFNCGNIEDAILALSALRKTALTTENEWALRVADLLSDKITPHG